MKKTYLISALILTTVFCCAGRVTITAYAEDTDTQATKKVQVKLIEDETPGVGLLKIAQASTLDFGEKAITINDLTFTETNSPSITIEDIRADAAGWNLAVSLGEFNDSAQNRQLKGVQLFYPTITMTTNGTVDVASRLPETISSDNGFESTAVKGLVLDSSATPNAEVLINATQGKGNGQWKATYGTDNKVELKVPAGNLAGNYTANLVYTLTDGPTQP